MPSQPGKRVPGSARLRTSRAPFIDAARLYTRGAFFSFGVDGWGGSTHPPARRACAACTECTSAGSGALTRRCSHLRWCESRNALAPATGAISRTTPPPPTASASTCAKRVNNSTGISVRFQQGPQVSGAASRQLVVPHRWGTRAGRVVTPASPGRPPREGGAGHSGPFPFRESVEGNPARCTDGGAGCSLAVHAPQNALMCDGTNRGALLCTARVSQPHVGACGIGRENPIMTVPRC